MNYESKETVWLVSSIVYDTEVVVGIVSDVIGTHGSGTVRIKSLVCTIVPIVVLNWIVYVPTSVKSCGDTVTRPVVGLSVTMLGFARAGVDDTSSIVAV